MKYELRIKDKFTVFQNKVYSIVKRIPRGKVATYQAVARAIGKSRAVRAVGNALNKNHDSKIPCHRVIRSDGAVGGFAYGENRKVKLLQSEGILILNSRIGPKYILYKF